MQSLRNANNSSITETFRYMVKKEGLLRRRCLVSGGTCFVVTQGTRWRCVLLLLDTDFRLLRHGPVRAAVQTKKKYEAVLTHMSLWLVAFKSYQTTTNGPLEPMSRQGYLEKKKERIPVGGRQWLQAAVTRRVALSAALSVISVREAGRRPQPCLLRVSGSVVPPT
ncbi:unnamed protein product [Spodoptera exigua]|nr:unnamed protein product [Spodoptera exigua]